MTTVFQQHCQHVIVDGDTRTIQRTRSPSLTDIWFSCTIVSVNIYFANTTCCFSRINFNNIEVLVLSNSLRATRIVCVFLPLGFLFGLGSRLQSSCPAHGSLLFLCSPPFLMVDVVSTDNCSTYCRPPFYTGFVFVMNSLYYIREEPDLFMFIYHVPMNFYYLTTISDVHLLPPSAGGSCNCPSSIDTPFIKQQSWLPLSIVIAAIPPTRLTVCHHVNGLYYGLLYKVDCWLSCIFDIHQIQ